MIKHALLLTAAGLVLISAGAVSAGQEKVELCHRGHTIAVAAPAVPAHVAHGDTTCDCAAIDDCAAQGGVLDENCDCDAGQSQACEPAGTCDSEFAACGSGGSCICATGTDGGGACIDAESPCGIACPNGDADCPAGTVCIIDSCCDGPACGVDCATP